MRKPRDFDSELKALNDKAKQLKERKVHQLGELVIATGADALSVEELGGLLLAGVGNKEANAKESWRMGGTAFFRRATGNASDGDRGNTNGAPAGDSGAAPARSPTRTD